MGAFIPVALQNAVAGDLVLFLTDEKAILGVLERLLDKDSDNPKAVIGYQRIFNPAIKDEETGMYFPNIERGSSPLDSLSRYVVYLGRDVIAEIFNSNPLLKPYLSFSKYCETLKRKELPEHEGKIKPSKP
ncbi:MAG: hypothetical protein AABY00_00090 [Nanoarchaeota archaeon]